MYVSAIVSYDRKALLDISAITNFHLEEEFYFNEMEAKDIDYCGPGPNPQYSEETPECGIPDKTTSKSGKLPLPSILLVNMQSLENKLDKLRSKPSHQRDLNNCNILCCSELWLNKDIVNITLAAFLYMAGQNGCVQEAQKIGGVCLFVNNSWCAISNIKS